MFKTIAIIILLRLVLVFAQETDTLYILQTTDIHGNIYPYDYFRDEPADYGLAKVYTKVVEFRKKHKNVILVDGGDLIQGTPMVYYFNRVETTVPHPMILTLNYMVYDAFAVGNHDIEQGLFTYLRAQSQSNFPWLSANAVLPDGATFFDPYTIIDINGIEVAILGLTTPGIPMWLDESLFPGITWTDMVETAAAYMTNLRPQADVMVGLFHAGFNEGYSAGQTEALGLPNENASRLVAEQVPGFDVVFSGHSHQPEPLDKSVTIRDWSSPLLMNAGSWGRNLAVAQIILQKENGENSQNSHWQITEKNGWLIPMKDVEPSAAILQLTEYYHQKALDYIRTEIAFATDTLHAGKARFRDHALVEVINKAQMQATGADISFAACFNDRLVIPPGVIRIKDIYGMYRYENFLYVVEMTGQQIKDFLEYSARYYMWDGKEVKPNPEIQGYNYDMAEGIRYLINVRKKPGQRISDLTDLKTGQPLKMDRIYKVAMNSYRATGGGGHMAAAGAKDAPVIWKSNEEMRNILADYIRQQGKLTPAVDGNWRLSED